MKLGDLFPRKYFSGEDLKGQIHNVTITRVTKEQMETRSGKKEIIILYAKELAKGVTMGKAMAYSIAEILKSDETNDWIGKQVQLYTESVRVAGQQKIAVRARPVPVAAQKPVQQPASLDLGATIQPDATTPSNGSASVLPGGSATVSTETGNGNKPQSTETTTNEPISFAKYIKDATTTHKLIQSGAEYIAKELYKISDPGGDYTRAYAALPFFAFAKVNQINFKEAKDILMKYQLDAQAALPHLQRLTHRAG